MEELNREFELGRLYYDRAEFAQALGHLETAAAGFLSSKSYKEYLEAIVLVLRLYAEQERFEEIHAAKEKLQDLVLNQGFELNSRTYYVLGICAASKGQETVALDYFQKALALGLSTDNKPDICHAIYGLAKIYTSPSVNRFQDALKEIYNLEVFFQVYDIPDLRLSAMLLNADILNQMKKHDEAV